MKMNAATQRIINADDGKVLTNGETFGKTVILPIEADYSMWKEVTEAEAKEIITRMEAEADV